MHKYFISVLKVVGKQDFVIDAEDDKQARIKASERFRNYQQLEDTECDAVAIAYSLSNDGRMEKVEGVSLIVTREG